MLQRQIGNLKSKICIKIFIFPYPVANFIDKKQLFWLKNGGIEKFLKNFLFCYQHFRGVKRRNI